MSYTRLEPGGEVALALAQACRTRSAGVLSDPHSLRDFLGGFAPSHPYEAELITTAAEVDAAGMLASHLGAGLDLDTAVHLTSTALEVLHPVDATSSRWVTIEFARALGYDVSALTPIAADVPTAGRTPAAPVATEASGTTTSRLHQDGTGLRAGVAPALGGEPPAADEPASPPAAWTGLVASEKAATATERQHTEERRESERREARERARLAAEAATTITRAGPGNRKRPRWAGHYTNSGKPLWIVIVAGIITYLLMAASQHLPPFGHGKSPGTTTTTTTTTTTLVPPGGGPASIAQPGRGHGSAGTSPDIRFAGSTGVAWYLPGLSSAVSDCASPSISAKAACQLFRRW